MATKTAYRRLTKEFMELQKNPPPFITAKPNESNILEWHYVIQGPPDTPYQGGEYYGRLTFPSDYPYKPPSIRMSTPSGRFQPDTRLCLTMSDFHPSLWNPSWSVATILNGLLSFMTTDENTTGSIRTTDAEKRLYAMQSHNANMKMPKFRGMFPELCTLHQQAPVVHDDSLRRRHVDERKSAQQQPPQQAVVNKAAPTQIAQQEPSRFARTMSRWKRWTLVLVVFVYLILSKIASRSAGGGE